MSSLKRLRTRSFLTAFTLTFGALQAHAQVGGILLDDLTTEELAGFDVENGGDVLLCSTLGGPKNSAGHDILTLDFILTRPLFDLSEAQAIKSLPQQLDRIEAILAGKAPTLGRDFQAFRKHLFNQKDLGAPRIWLPEEFGLHDLSDEKLLGLLPPNCLDVDAKPSLKQAVVRSAGSPILYHYDRALLDSLAVEAPLQLSMLVVHEWLWDYFPARKIHNLRLLNALLHSNEVSKMPAPDLVKVLQNFGLKRKALGESETGSAKLAEKIKVNGTDACALTSDRKVHCWGRNKLLSSVPKDLLAQDLILGRNFACMLTLEGQVDCWGEPNKSPALAQLEQLRGIQAIASDQHALVCVRSATETTCASARTNDGGYSRDLNQFFKIGRIEAIYLTLGYACYRKSERNRCYTSGGYDDRALAKQIEAMHYSDSATVFHGNGAFCAMETEARLECVAKEGHALLPIVEASWEKEFKHLSFGIQHFCYELAGEPLQCMASDGEDAWAEWETHTPLISDLLSMDSSYGVTCAILQEGKVRCFGRSWENYPLPPAL